MNSRPSTTGGPLPEKVTITSIMSWFEDAIRHGHPISTATWIDGASKVVSLLQDFNEEAIVAEMAYRELRATLISQGRSGVESETIAKGSPIYAKHLRMKAERERIEQWCQLAKKRTEVKDF